MILEDHTRFKELDPADMLSFIDRLPDQLESAWDLGRELPSPGGGALQQVLVAGMGGSAIGADLLAAFLEPTCPVPIHVLRDYSLPAWANGSHTLVIAASHSGNTEETLSAFEEAQKRGCSLMVITTGGKLADLANEAGAPVWRFQHNGQPRAAIGFSFGLLLAAFHRLGLAEDPGAELDEALGAMRRQQEQIRAAVPVVQNPAKRMAGQLMGRWVSVFGAEVLAPVARRWKGQISEIAKAWAQFESLPEADHNTLAGLLQPEQAFSHSMMLFLMAPTYHPRNTLRSELTRKIFMLEGLNTDFVIAQGKSRLANLWTCLHFGDYTAYYLAMAYGVDPTPVHAIESLKAELKSADS